MCRKFFVRGAAFFSALLLLSGCGAKPPNSKAGLPLDDSTNPFAIDAGELFGGSVGHGFLGLSTVDSKDAKPLIYEGGEMEVPYYINASGNMKEPGLLLFIDGVPQPFRVGDAAPAYMNQITLTEDNRDEEITLRFTPLTGTRGEEKNICVTSITNPAFQPDLVNSASYGFYHQILPMTRRIRFNADAPAEAKGQGIEALTKTTISAQPLTQSYLDGVDNGLRGDGVEKLENPLIVELLLNREDTKLMDSFSVEGKNPLKITYRLVGTPGVRYKTTFYLNHQPLTTSGIAAFETGLTRESVITVEAEVDFSALSLPGTFYAITTLCSEENEFPDAIAQYKTRSLLLYQS